MSHPKIPDFLSKKISRMAVLRQSLRLSKVLKESPDTKKW